MMGSAVLLHVIAVVIWVGGMFFAYMFLRPVAAAQLEPPERLKLWVGVFSNFFPWVWTCVVVILATGLHLIFAKFNGFAGAPVYVHAMFVDSPDEVARDIKAGFERRILELLR